MVDLEVAFLSSLGAQPYHDPGFGVTVAWNVDLLAGYRWTLLARKPLVAKAGWLLSASRWLRRQDIVVLHGHADPDMLLAVVACRLLRVPYLLRGDSHPESTAVGWRRLVRHLLATFVVRSAAGALPIGRLNAAFYDRYGRISHYTAPYSVDNDRFRTMSDAARPSRMRRLESLGLDPERPTIIFSGKLVPQKRPLDAVHAIAHSNGALNLVMLGDGPLRGFVPLIEALAVHNGVRDRVHVEVAMVGGTRTPGARVGVLSDDQRWSASSHGTPDRPAGVSVPQLMAAHGIGHVGLLKMDIEGGEFAVMAPGEDLLWLERVRQIALEVHPAFGDAPALIERLRERGFSVDLRENDGRPSASTSPDLTYAYCSR